MSDYREDAARIICPYIYPHDSYDEAVDIVQIEAMQLAGSCIAAAEPHLRRKHRQELIDELAAKARSLPSGINSPFEWIDILMVGDAEFEYYDYNDSIAQWILGHDKEAQ